MDTDFGNLFIMIVVMIAGASGKAYLFQKVWNIKEEEACIRDMLTGRHLVRDVSCLFCNAVSFCFLFIPNVETMASNLI